MTVKTREKKGAIESWTSHCRPFPKGHAKETAVLERVKFGSQRVTQVAKVAKMQVREERAHGQGQETDGKGDIRARWTCGKAGHMVSKGRQRRQLVRRPLRKHLTMMTSCKCGVCWKKAKMSRGKRWSAVETNKGEERQSSFTFECGEQSKFGPEENH